MATFHTAIPEGSRLLRRGLKARIDYDAQDGSTSRAVTVEIDGNEGDCICIDVHPSRAKQLADCFERLATMLRNPQYANWEVRS